MSTLPACPQCTSAFTYEDRGLYVCPECAHEWDPQATPAASDEDAQVYRDSAGNLLQDGDSVIVIKDLKLKGSSKVVDRGGRSRRVAKAARFPVCLCDKLVCRTPTP